MRFPTRRPHPVTLALLLCLAPGGKQGVAIAKDSPATVTPAPREGGWMERHAAINQRAEQGDVDLLFMGDSITEGWGENAVWKKHYGERKAMNAGIGGDQTQHVLWRLEHGNVDGISPKLAVVMIGTNNSGGNTAKDIAAGITAIVEQLRERLPETKILLLGIFPRGAGPDDKQRKVNSATNALIEPLADGEMVVYRDIGPKFLEKDGTLSKEVMPDLLHLSERGYQIWADSIEDVVEETLAK